MDSLEVLFGISLAFLLVFSLLFLIDKICKASIEKKIKPDATLIDFNKAKYNIAYKNKVKQVKAKISELERSNVHRIIAEQIAGSLIVQIADVLVEQDRKSGKLDDLYSEK